MIFCVDEDYSPAKTVAAIKGMIPYRPGATSVDAAAPAFVPGAPPPANPTWVHSSSRFVPPPAAQAPRWAPPQEDADLARALAASRADMQRPPPVPSVDADLERALAASVAESYAPSYVQSTADLVDDDADDDFDLRRALAASLAETRPAASYYAPPPPAPATSYAPPPPAGPRGEAEVLLREMGISPHLADLFVQQEISRDVAQAVERADLEGCCRSPTSSSSYAGSACTSMCRRARARLDGGACLRRDLPAGRLGEQLLWERLALPLVRLICLIRNIRLILGPDARRRRAAAAAARCGGGGCGVSGRRIGVLLRIAPQ